MVLKVTSGIINASNILQAKGHSNEEETVVQATKGTAHDSTGVKNKHDSGTGDPTACGNSN